MPWAMPGLPAVRQERDPSCWATHRGIFTCSHAHTEPSHPGGWPAGWPVQRTRGIAARLEGRNKRGTGRGSVSCWAQQAGPALHDFPSTVELSKRVLQPDAVIRLDAVHREKGTAE